MKVKQITVRHGNKKKPQNKLKNIVFKKKNDETTASEQRLMNEKTGN